MITLTEALSQIRDHSSLLPVEQVSVDDAAGRVLREVVVADRDFPPYDRVMMDGIAILSESLKKGAQWQMQARQTAGEAPLSLKDKGYAIGIATGAVLPDGCDTIIPKEAYEGDGATIRLNDGETVEAGQYIHRKGSDRQKGEALIEAGTRLTAKELGVCAACGAAELAVSGLPKVAIAARRLPCR